MKWYAASAIMYFELKPPARQNGFVIWENVYLVRAPSVAVAKRKAELFARSAAGDDGGDLSLDGKPATLVFGGLRKVVECFGDPTTSQPSDVLKMHDGVEATYSTLVVAGRKELDQLIKGKPVDVLYRE